MLCRFSQIRHGFYKILLRGRVAVTLTSTPSCGSYQNSRRLILRRHQALLMIQQTPCKTWLSFLIATVCLWEISVSYSQTPVGTVGILSNCIGYLCFSHNYISFSNLLLLFERLTWCLDIGLSRLDYVHGEKVSQCVQPMVRLNQIVDYNCCVPCNHQYPMSFAVNLGIYDHIDIQSIWFAGLLSTSSVITGLLGLLPL